MQELRRDGLGAADNVLAGYAAVLSRRWPIILAGTSAVVAVAALYAAVATPVYEAAVTLQVVAPRRSSFLTSYGSPAPPAGTRASAVARTRTLLESASLASSIIDELGLSKAPFEMTTERFLAHHLVVSEVRSADFLRVAVRLPDPGLSARAANRLAEVAVVQSRVRTQSEAKTLRDFVTKELEAARARLGTARSRLEESKAPAGQIVRGRPASREPPGEREIGSATVEEINYDVVRRIYIELALQREALAIEESVAHADFRVFDPARTPDRPVYPQTSRTIAIGLAAGLVLSVIAAFVYDAVVTAGRAPLA
jgi:uncharacterized protein involved in exopolysaccharide biosynthesis